MSLDGKTHLESFLGEEIVGLLQAGYSGQVKVIGLSAIYDESKWPYSRESRHLPVQRQCFHTGVCVAIGNEPVEHSRATSIFQG